MVGWVIAKLNGGIDGIISKKWGTYTRLHHSTNRRDVSWDISWDNQRGLQIFRHTRIWRSGDAEFSVSGWRERHWGLKWFILEQKWIKFETCRDSAVLLEDPSSWFIQSSESTFDMRLGESKIIFGMPNKLPDNFILTNRWSLSPWNLWKAQQELCLDDKISPPKKRVSLVEATTQTPWALMPSWSTTPRSSLLMWWLGSFSVWSPVLSLFLLVSSVYFHGCHVFTPTLRILTK